MNRKLRRGQSRKAKRSLSRSGSGPGAVAALDKALASATQLHQAGRFREAEALYRRVLESHPDHPYTLHLLGLLRHQEGRHEEAILLLSRAAHATPDEAPFHYNLGEALRLAGRTADAIASYRRAVELAPGVADPHFGLGNALLDQGEAAAAAESYERALALAPGDAEALLGLGNALASLGRAGEALARFEAALAQDPALAAAWTGTGLALLALERAGEAAAAFEKALAGGADPVLPRLNLGRMREAAGALEEAIAHYRAALEAAPDDAGILNRIGYAMLLWGEPKEARAHIDRALMLDPDLADAHFSSGFHHQQQGRFAESVACFEAALERAPGHGQALYALATMQDAGDTEERIARIEASLKAVESGDARSALEFALAKLLDAQGRYDDAFRRVASANAARAAIVQFNADAYSRATDALIAATPAEFFEARHDFGDPRELPVLIVGMPRSGTTLVEQILASHPEVHGAGELDNLRALIATLPERLGMAEVYPTTLAGIDAEGSRALGAEHLAALAALAPEASQVVDKMPNNFLRLAFVALALPGTRIIHCRRDSIDTCLSCFFQYFAIGQEFTYDLAHLGQCYRDYERLMTHWRAVLPLSMLDVRYEDLVADQETVSRRMVEFCGLDWDASCLRYYETRRTVRSASLWQVRQPVYTSSIGRWRRYEAHLGPLIEALGLVEGGNGPEGSGPGRNGPEQ